MENLKRLISEIVKKDESTSAYFALQNNKKLHKSFSIITNLGSSVAIGIMMLCFLITGFDQSVRLVLLILIFEVIGLPVIIALRYATRRKRPVELSRRIRLDVWNKYSFPSHHAYRCFMIASILGLSYITLMPIFYSLASIIGFSRIYLLKHYPSDVIIGAILGIFIGSMSIFL